jgi:type VI secretion system protein ImpC
MQFSMGNVDFELSTSTSPAPLRTADDTPFCIAILADFSGRGNRGLGETSSSLAARQRIHVDVDNFEALLAKLETEIHVPVSGEDGPCIAVQFGELDDFHPDRIFDRLEVLQSLKVARKRLQDPTTFAEAASQVRSWVTGQPDTGQSERAQAENAPAVSQESR